MSHDDDLSLDELARRAAEGDRQALSALVRDLQHPMYRLALRFLGHPDDAQDACQEILVRIVTRLGTFEGRSKFTTWASTVAVRSLLRTRKRLVEASVQGAEAFAAFLDAGMGVAGQRHEVRVQSEPVSDAEVDAVGPAPDRPDEPIGQDPNGPEPNDWFSDQSDPRH
jgi:RNA polymerase sigma factor (sigma-70 family)